MSFAACPRCGRPGCTAWEGVDPEKEADCLKHVTDWRNRATRAERALRKIQVSLEKRVEALREMGHERDAIECDCTLSFVKEKITESRR